MICERCGRHLDRLEGRIGDLDYCHPDDPDLPDCYTLTNHEHTFGKVLETPEDFYEYFTLVGQEVYLGEFKVRK